MQPWVVVRVRMWGARRVGSAAAGGDDAGADVDDDADDDAGGEGASSGEGVGEEEEEGEGEGSRRRRLLRGGGWSEVLLVGYGAAERGGMSCGGKSSYEYISMSIPTIPIADSIGIPSASHTPSPSPPPSPSYPGVPPSSISITRGGILSFEIKNDRRDGRRDSCRGRGRGSQSR